MAVPVLVCGTWRIEVVNLDGVECFKVTHGPYRVGHGPYPRTVEQVARVLEQARGPALGEFGEE